MGRGGAGVHFKLLFDKLGEAERVLLNNVILL